MTDNSLRNDPKDDRLARKDEWPPTYRVGFGYVHEMQNRAQQIREHVRTLREKVKKSRDNRAQVAVYELERDTEDLLIDISRLKKLFSRPVVTFDVDQDTFLKDIDSLDDWAAPIAAKLLELHGLQHIADRVRFVYWPEYGSLKTLKWVLLSVYEGSPTAFVHFYENISPEEEPHYENALAVAVVVLATLTLVATIGAPFMAAKYAEALREKASKIDQRRCSTHESDLLKLLKYLLGAYALREAKLQGKISVTHLRNKLTQLRALTLSLDVEVKRKPTTSTALPKIVQDWLSEHEFEDLSLLKHELMGLAQKELEKQATAMSASGSIMGPRGWIKVQGIGRYPGIASGTARIIRERLDLRSIKDGDIGVFCVFEHEMLEDIRKCAALVGTSTVGGPLGHFAIVGAALEKPTVVGLSGELISDSMILWVDGGAGAVYIKPKKQRAHRVKQIDKH